MRWTILTLLFLSLIAGMQAGCGHDAPEAMGPRLAPADKERSVPGVRSHYGITDKSEDDQ